MPGAFRRLSVLALLLSVAPAALAQLPASAVVQHLPQADDPAELLAQALRTLATEPGNLSALIAAGHNALALGDPNAAVGFLGRAQEISPRDGKVKAGLGSALVQLEKPQEALRLFAEATRLGVSDADLAEDRGLAYDLTGDPGRAQRDYQTVLAAHPDDDTARRRLALSQGISGNKAGAIATLDPLIRKRDIAAWRAQTFVLAMDGDTKGANDITRIMLPQQAAMLQPFLVRLARLSPAEKARAVHFGEMPTSGHAYTPTEVASSGPPATYASAATPTAAPRSDLAPPPQTIAASQQPRTPSQSAPAAIAAGQPKPVPPASRAAPVKQPGNVEVASRDAIFALGQPYYQRAPLAGIALTPAKPSPSAVVTSSPPPTATLPSPTPSTPNPAPSPPEQVAQAEPPRTETLGSPALPTPAAVGHYDLPHDAAARAPARLVRSGAPAMKTVGTPVVHGKADTATKADDGDADAVPRAKRGAHDTTDEADTKVAKGHGAKASPKPAVNDDDADGTTARGKSKNGKTSKSAATADEDCVAPAKTRTRKSKSRKAPVACTKLTAADDDSDARTKSAKGAHAKAKTSDDDSTSDAKSTKGKHAKGKASSDEDDTVGPSPKSKSKASDKGSAERVYVQVAGGANKEDMDKAWAGVKKKAPELMKGRTPMTTPLRATNRLLVGPFKSEDEAQAFVNKMSGKGVSGFTFKSGKGQKVEKVDTGG